MPLAGPDTGDALTGTVAIHRISFRVGTAAHARDAATRTVTSASMTAAGAPAGAPDLRPSGRDGVGPCLPTIARVPQGSAVHHAPGAAEVLHEPSVPGATEPTELPHRRLKNLSNGFKISKP